MIYQKSISALLLLLIFSLFAAEKRMVAYYNGVRELSDAQNIQYDKLTHINIESLMMDSSDNLIFGGHEWAEIAGKEQIETIKARSKEHGVKVSIVLGYDEYTKSFINDSADRSNLAKQLVNYCLENNYDGVDLDFEGAYDGNAYELFAKEVRQLLPDDKLLTAAVSNDTVCWNNNNAWTDTMLSYCDWVNIMIYCIRGTWSTSPIGSPANYKDFVESATRWSKRLPKEKLVLGMPTFSVTYVDPGTSWWVDTVNYGVRRMWGVDWWSSNNIDYRHVIKYFPEELRNDTVAGGYYLTLADIGLTTDKQLREFHREVGLNSGPAPKATDMLGKTCFSGPKEARKKAEWAANNGFSGMMINHLHEDVTTACDYIDHDYLDSLSIISNLYKGFYTPSATLTPTNNKAHVKPELSVTKGVIKASEPVQTVTLYTLNGRKVLSLSAETATRVFTLPTTVTPNLYISKVRGVDQRVTTSKLLVTF